MDGEAELDPFMLSETDGEFAELTDDTITDEQIADVKNLGLSKPPLVGWPRWVGPKDIKQRHEHIIHLAALGLTNTQIQKELGGDIARLSIIVNTPEIKRAILLKREEYFGADSRAYIKAVSNKAFAVLDHVLSDETEKGSTRLDAAKYVIDQTIGKAQQNLKVEGGLLAEMIHKLDTQIKDAVPLQENSLAEPQSAVDAFVDQFTKDAVVIGQRGKDAKSGNEA